MPLWLKWILGAIGAAATVASIGWFVWASVRVAEAQDWPRAQGIVVATRVAEDRNESSDADGRGTSVTYSYRPVIAYTYRVGGRMYGSNRIWLADGPSWDNPAEAQAFLADYPLRGPVSVVYNPADPSDAALIVAPPTAAVFIGTALGLIFLAVAWFVPADRPGAWPRDRLPGRRRRLFNRARR